jgi:hypothetical protein
MFTVIGCAGPVEPVSTEEALVTYTITYDVAEFETSFVRIMLCDTVTGMCEIDEPTGCRFSDESGVSGHICDITVAENETLAFNIQTDSGFVCATDDAECARLGTVRVFRDGLELVHIRDVHGEFCNFLIPVIAPPVAELSLDGI